MRLRLSGRRTAVLSPPETVTSDHRSVYKNRHLVQVARTPRTVVLPTRVMRAQDKAACERAFSHCDSHPSFTWWRSHTSVAHAHPTSRTPHAPS